MKILNTKESIKIADNIFAFEIGFFDPLLDYKIEEFEHWHTSEAFFCCTIIDERNGEQPEILGTVSFLNTDLQSLDKLKRGLIKECDLEPATGETRHKALYFSSLICKTPFLAKTLLSNIFREMVGFGVEAEVAYTIVMSESGYKFALKNHFRNTMRKYLCKYPILELKPVSSEMLFDWDKILKSPIRKISNF